jgi:hypothetical protein
MLKGTAISALLSNVQAMVKQSWPAIAPQVEQTIKHITEKVGGHPLPDREEQRHASGPARDHRAQPSLI